MSSYSFALHNATRYRYVCKILNRPLSELTPAQREEVDVEVRLLRCFNHPNIVRFVDSYVNQNTLVQHILMVFCAGGTLAKAIERADGEYFSEAQIMEWYVQALDGLRYIHAQGVLHRDLKPQNLLLWGRGGRVVKIADFGISTVVAGPTVTEKGLCGTPYYMSPEQCEGRPYDARADVWSLGCVLFECCCLRRAIAARTGLECFCPSTARLHFTAAMMAWISLVAGCVLQNIADRENYARPTRAPSQQRGHVRGWHGRRRL